MGSSTSSEKSPPQPPKAPPKFCLEALQQDSLLACHFALLKKQENGGKVDSVSSVPVQILARELRVPARVLQGWLVNNTGSSEGFTSQHLVQAVTEFVDPQSPHRRRRNLWGAYTNAEGVVTNDALKELVKGSLDVAAALAEDFGGVNLSDLKGNTPDSCVLDHFTDSQNDLDLEAFDKWASKHFPSVADAIGFMILCKARTIAQADAGETEAGKWELSEAEEAEVQHKVMKYFPLMDSSKGGSDVFSTALLWAFGVLWEVSSY